MIRSTLLRPWFYQRNEKEKITSRVYFFNISDNSHNITSTTIINIYNIIMLEENNETNDGQEKEDIKIFCEKVSNGTLYEYMAQEIKKHTNIDIQDRRELKSMIFCVLFFDNRFIGQKKLNQREYSRICFRQSIAFLN